MKMIAFAALAAGFLVVPAAQAQQAPVTVTVVHADLDLSRPSDVARLDGRIADAARSGCRSPNTLAFGAREAGRACRLKARASAQTARNAAVAHAQGSELASARH